LRRILVLTQYKARSLDRHLRSGWNFLSAALDEYVDVLPPQQRIDETWYKGTADAIYQNIYSIEKEGPKYVLVLAGDHIYKMNYGEMIRFHVEHHADLTIGAIPVPVADCKQFGVIETDDADRIVGFREKPDQAVPLASEPGHALGSMGIYIFNARPMYERLCDDAACPGSGHDFGKDVIPSMIQSSRVFAFRFRDRNRKAVPYWRDVGTLDAYYQANMDLIEIDPVLNLYDADWPIRTAYPMLPPPKTVFNQPGAPGGARRGEAIDSMVCNGCVISGGHVSRSILSPNVRVNSYAIVEDSILYDRVDVGRYARVRRAIVDKDVRIPAHASVGFDPEHDRQRGFTVTDQDVVVIAKGVGPEDFLKAKR
jgi:glucose-1-phosphate adenylyltransferase